ncbi:MAG: hypothetical protein ABMA02_09660 [Saprospiraceae bacterium]
MNGVLAAAISIFDKTATMNMNKALYFLLLNPERRIVREREGYTLLLHDIKRYLK